MTVESFMREHPRPLLLVPVNFSYEKLLEGRTLVAELEGQPKQGESLGALARRGAPPAARIRQRARRTSARRCPSTSFSIGRRPAGTRCKATSSATRRGG